MFFKKVKYPFKTFTFFFCAFLCFSIQSSDTTSYKTSSTISFRFHSNVTALVAHCVQPRKILACHLQRGYIYCQNSVPAPLNTTVKRVKVLAIKHWVAIYNTPYQREVKQGFDHWHHCIPLNHTTSSYINPRAHFSEI